MEKISSILDLSNSATDIYYNLVEAWSFDPLTTQRDIGVVPDERLNKLSEAKFEEIEAVKTNLDLASFLNYLARKEYVLNIPEYTVRRPEDVRLGYTLLSKQNRHGKILSLIANKYIFSFSVRIMDANVISSTGVGEPRNFLLTDLSGNCYEGWHNLEYTPNQPEFGLEKGALVSVTTKEVNGYAGSFHVKFENFINPNKWISFYGRKYLVTKLALERIALDIESLKILSKSLPKTPGVRPDKKEKRKREKGTPVKVQTLVAALVGFQFFNTSWITRNEAIDREHLEKLLSTYKKQKQLLQFACRTVEFAFYKFIQIHPELPKPTWVFTSWTVVKQKRTSWWHLPLNHGCSLKFRVFKKSEIVRN